MFCGKCGSYVEGDQPLCAKCAAEEAASQSDVFTESAAPADDTFELNTSGSDDKKSPKRKRGLIAGIVAGVAAASIGLGAFFGWDYIKAFTDRTFKSPEDYFVEVQKTAIAQYSDELTQSYGKMLDMYYNEDGVEYTGFEAEYKVTVGDQVLDLVEPMLAQSGVDMDLSWLKDIRMNMSVNSKDSLLQLVAGAALGNNKIISMDMIMNAEDGNAYIGIPELSKQYLYANLGEEMFSTADLDEMRSAIAEAAAMGDKVIGALPTEEELDALLDKYIEIALNCIDDVEKENGKIEVGEASQSVVALTANITPEDMMEIAEAVLEEARDDKDLKKIINNLDEAMSELYGGEMGLYDVFVSSVDEMLEELEYVSEDVDDEGYLELITYVDMKNEVRGYEVTVYADDEPLMDTMSWLTAQKGKTTYTEIAIATVEIVGEEIENRKTTTGSYELSAEGMDILVVEYETEDDIRTTLRLIPGDDIMDMILGNMDLPGALFSGGNLALELSFGEDEDGKSFFEAGVLASKNKLISVGVAAKGIEGGKISVPSNAINMEDYDGLMQWLGDADFSKVMENLANAGFPQDLLDMAQNYLDLMSGYDMGDYDMSDYDEIEW